MSIELVGQGQVNIAGVKFHIDLFVDSGLAVLVKVLSNERHVVETVIGAAAAAASAAAAAINFVQIGLQFAWFS